MLKQALYSIGRREEEEEEEEQEEEQEQDCCPSAFDCALNSRQYRIVSYCIVLHCIVI